MDVAPRVVLRRRRDRDLGEIVSWVPDAASLSEFSGPRLSWPLAERGVRDLTAEQGLLAYVMAAPSDEVVGHFDLSVSEGVARLGRVIVSPRLRGRGLGGTLIEMAVSEARRLGAVRIRLNVVSTNVPALRTYRRAGFVEQRGDPSRADITVMERPTTSPPPRGDSRPPIAATC